MGVLRVKFGVAFNRIDPAGFRILGSLDRITREAEFDLYVTCGSDSHPASNPHTLGRAYDVRTHDMPPGRALYVLRAVLLDLQESHNDELLELLDVGMPNIATRRFYGQLESNHLHFQQRKGVIFP